MRCELAGLGVTGWIPGRCFLAMSMAEGHFSGLPLNAPRARSLTLPISYFRAFHGALAFAWLLVCVRGASTKFHFVAHTMQPDQNNFPPHTAWIHLHFSIVRDGPPLLPTSIDAAYRDWPVGC